MGERATDPVDVVGHLGAVQAQNHPMSLWSIGRRCGAGQAQVEEALGGEAVVRTHVLRPTWHHVLLDDLGDLLEITAPRIERLMASTDRAQGVAEDRMRAGADVVADAVRADGPLTRDEIASRLETAGFRHAGIPLAHQVMLAETSGRVAWSRTVRSSTVVVDVSVLAPPHAQVRSGIESEAWALARFLDREAVVRITS